MKTFSQMKTTYPLIGITRMANKKISDYPTIITSNKVGTELFVVEKADGKYASMSLDTMEAHTHVSTDITDLGTTINTAVSNAVSGLVDSSPETLDTLEKLADALGDDANFASSLTTSLSGKLDKNTAITGGTATKITYDSKGLVTSGTTLSATDVPSLEWSKISSGTPTTLSGYGITDAVGSSDSRLSDARTPTAHNQAWSTITTPPTTLSGYGITDAVGSSDSRLSDARTPTAHNQAWSTITDTPTSISGYGITDAVGSSDSRLSDSRTPTAHNQAWSTITTPPTTLSGYGITDAEPALGNPSADGKVLSSTMAGVRSWIAAGSGGGSSGASIGLNKITVMPVNTAAFPTYGIQQFTDLNAAWASIPRTDFSYPQTCNDWVVMIPPGTYTPASCDSQIRGITISGSNQILEWGYTYGCVYQTGTTTNGGNSITALNNVGNLVAGMIVTGPNVPLGTTITSILSTTSVQISANATAAGSALSFVFADPNKSLIGKTITGTGIPSGTTITAIGLIPGQYLGTGLTYTAGSNTVVGFTNAVIAGLQPGMVCYSGGGAVLLPYTYITSVTNTGTPATNAITVAIPATGTGSASMTVGGSCYALISQAATVSSRDNVFSVNNPLLVNATLNSSTSVTGCNYVCSAMVGQTVTGSGIPSATTVTAFTYNATTNQGTLTLSQAATTTGASVLSFQIPWQFFCEIQTKKISNIALGPVELGDMTKAYPPNFAPSAWSPIPGTDHFIDLFILPACSPSAYTNRTGWHWQSIASHSDAQLTHDSYISKCRLSGTVKMQDAFLNNQPNQHYNFGDFEVWGNPAYVTYSQQTGTTSLASTAVTVLTSTAGLIPGQAVSGTGIAADTYIQSITSATALVITKPATAAGAVTLTFGWSGVSTPSIDCSTMAATWQAFSFYKSRIRGSILGYSLQGTGPGARLDLSQVENTEFDGLITAYAIDHIQNTAIKGGLVWANNSVGFDSPGLFGCQIASTASFNGTSSAPLKMDGFTNYYFKTAAAVLGSGTPKLILNDVTSASVSLTAQTATIASNTIFTPASDGTYQISVYCSTTTAGSAGTVTPALGWKDDSTTQALSLTAVNLATLGNYVQQILMVKCKSGQPITYSATVAGVTGTPQFSIYVTIVNIG